MDVQITEGPKEPCDRPAPGPETDQATHSHIDGRVCAWDSGQSTWLTVAAVPKSDFEITTQVGPPPQQAPSNVIDLPVDQKARGMYPKFVVKRLDGRDEPGGDRDGARQAYLVLDPIYDPAARPALALYSMLVRQMGYEAYADDLDHNLAILNSMVSDALATQPGPHRGRVVATWTYEVDPAAEGYHNDQGEPLPLADAVLVDQTGLAEHAISIEDVASWADDESMKVRMLPDA